MTVWGRKENVCFFLQESWKRTYRFEKASFMPVKPSLRNGNDNLPLGAPGFDMG